MSNFNLNSSEYVPFQNPTRVLTGVAGAAVAMTGESSGSAASLPEERQVSNAADGLIELLASTNQADRQLAISNFGNMPFGEQAEVIQIMLGKAGAYTASMLFPGSGVTLTSLRSFMNEFANSFVTNSRPLDLEAVSFINTVAAAVAHKYGQDSFIYLALDNIGRAQVPMEAQKFKHLVDNSLNGGWNPVLSEGRSYSRRLEPLFGPEGPKPTDVVQGTLDDCYFLAALSAGAAMDPDFIRSMIVDNENQTYAVRFYDDAGRAVWVPVDNQTSSAGAAPRGSSWVALVEKAYIKFRGGDNERTPERSIANGWDEGIRAVFGRQPSELDFTGLEARTDVFKWLETQLQTALAAHRTVLLATPARGVMDDSFTEHHMYAIVGYDERTHRFHLQNPFGGSLDKTAEEIFIHFHPNLPDIPPGRELEYEGTVFVM